MKAKQTICDVVLGLALVIGGCGGQSRSIIPCPVALPREPPIRVQKSELYGRVYENDELVREFVDSISGYNAKHRGVIIVGRFENEKFVGFDVYIYQKDTCYAGMNEEIADLFQDAINKLEESRK